jgi:hypothetical protein
MGVVGDGVGIAQPVRIGKARHRRRIFFFIADCGSRFFEDEPSVEHAIFMWKDSPAEFADCLINARHRRLGCRATATFDRKALKLAGFIEV